MANPKNDKPDTTHQKVDYSVILRRRRRGACDHVRSEGLTTSVAVRKNLAKLRKEYIVSAEFEAECLLCIGVAVTSSVAKTDPDNPIPAVVEANRRARAELAESLAKDEGYSFFDKDKKPTKKPRKPRKPKKDK